MPPDPLEWHILHAGTLRVPSSINFLKLSTGLPDQCQIASDSPEHYMLNNSPLCSELKWQHMRSMCLPLTNWYIVYHCLQIVLHI